MGWLKSIVGAAAPIVGGLVGGPVGSALGGMVGGAIGGSGQPKSTTSTATQQMDPRMQQLLWGNGQAGSSGLLQNWAALAGQAPGAGSQAAGQLGSNYMQGAAPDDVTAIRNSALGMMNSNSSAQVGNPLWTTNATIKAPAQNDLNLSGAFDKMINGNAGANPFLTSAIQGGIDQSTAAFGKMQSDATDSLQRTLSGIRSGAIGAGQYGGSRQAIVEGNAISDFTKQQQQAATQFGLGNTTAAVGAQADAFNQGQNRSLSAMQGLSGQQFSTAAQNAQFDQTAQLANQNVNTQYVLNNQNAALQSNQQNNAAKLAGAGMLSGLTNQMYGWNQAGDNAALQRAQQVSGILAPYVGQGGTRSETNPLYNNQGASALGGAAAGLGMFGQLGGSLSGLFGGSSPSMPTFNVSPGTAPVNTAGLQNLGWMNSLFGG